MHNSCLGGAKRPPPGPRAGICRGCVAFVCFGKENERMAWVRVGGGYPSPCGSVRLGSDPKEA